MNWRTLSLAAALAVQLCGQAAPETPAAKVFSRWLEAFNSGDRDRMKTFFEAHYPERAKQIDDALQFREATGGFNLVRIEKAESGAVAAVLKERESDTYARLEMEVAGEPPQVKRMGVRAIPRPADIAAVARMSGPEALASLDREAARQAAEGKFSGAVLVAQEGKTLFEKAYGLADREKKAPNTLDTQFRLGSMNKMFTAVATLQLVEAGKLSLGDPLSKVLPDYPNQELARKVTVRHLLTHTGGTGDIFGPEYEKNRLSLKALADYVKLYGARALKFEPGARWEYSNYGFLLLGYVVERVSGKSYYEYVRENIFQPAGMASTDSAPETENVHRRASGYMKEGGVWKSNGGTLPWRGTSAGGGYSTVRDLLSFAR
ncbi:MAG: beta-lactamase family protein, partial [Acidobacteria bacterium]|nr:beta-lactamase family protein [Acidobacteriota bacterium]